MVYYYLKLQMRECVISEVGRQLHEYSKACERPKTNRWINNTDIMKFEGIEIVDCTITELASYRDLISSLMPTIVVTEEAAETREAHIVAAMFSSQSLL